METKKLSPFDLCEIALKLGVHSAIVEDYKANITQLTQELAKAVEKKDPGILHVESCVCPQSGLVSIFSIHPERQPDALWSEPTALE